MILGDIIDPRLNQQVMVLYSLLTGLNHPGITEIVPAYASLTIYYNPDLVSYQELTGLLLSMDLNRYPVMAETRLVEVPVAYGGADGPDLEEVASMCALTPRAVIEMHSTPVYRVYMLGFTGGFPYLGPLPTALEVPRLTTPRQRVWSGAVGIAGRQTGIYPIAAPGGWRIIGRTNLPIFDPNRPQPALLAPGDLVRFVPVEKGGGL